VSGRPKVIATILIGGFLVTTVSYTIIRTGNTTHRSGSRPAETADSQSQPLPNAAPAISVSKAVKQDGRNELMNSLNHQPIEFYGHVIDQFGVPVGGAEVRAQVIYNTGQTAGVTKRTVLTDVDGNFELMDLRGRTLDFDIVKNGYSFIPAADAYDYTTLVAANKRHHPDKRKPVVLQMWKLQGADPLIARNAITTLVPDGRPYHIDLVAGTVVAANGDLVVRLFHGRQDSGAQISRYDWRAELAVVDGGLRPENRRITEMFFAPNEGYESTFIVEMPAQLPGWNRTYKCNFFMRIRNNLYCRLGIDLHTIPMGDSSYVNLTWWLNPTPGSHNLEFDPAKTAR
jgi:hypothetical protein